MAVYNTDSVTTDGRILFALGSDHWDDVMRLLKGAVSGWVRHLVLDELCRAPHKVATGELKHLLPDFTQQQRHTCLKPALQHGLWSVVRDLLTGDVTEDEREWVVDEVLARSHDVDVTYLQHILPHCVDRQLDPVLLLATERDMWSVASQLLTRGGSSSMRSRVIRSWSERGSTLQYRDFLPHCPDPDLGDVILTLAGREFQSRQWDAVAFLLQRSLPGHVRRQVLTLAGDNACRYSLVHNILPVCRDDDDVDVLLPGVCRRGQTDVLQEILLRHQPDDPHLQHVAHVAIVHCTNTSTLELALRRCKKRHHEPLVTLTVKGGHWHALPSLFTRYGASSRDGWAIMEASKAASEEQLTDIVRKCPARDAENVFAILLSRQLLSPLTWLLQHNITQSLVTQAVLQAAHKPITSTADEELVGQLVEHCPEELLDSVFWTLVGRQVWQPVLVMLPAQIRRGVKGLDSVVTSACKVVEERQVVTSLVPHCPSTCSRSVLIILMGRGLWRGVGKLLGGCGELVTDSVMLQAATLADEWSFVQWIVPHCPTSCLDLVLHVLLDRQLWLAAHKVILRDVTFERCKRAAERALELAAERREDRSRAATGRLRLVVLQYEREMVDQVLADMVLEERWVHVKQVLRLSGAFKRIKPDRNVCQYVGRSGMTVLHVAMASRLPRTVSQLVAKGANPLAVSLFGTTILSLAVGSDEPEVLMAECIKLGLTTHRPRDDVMPHVTGASGASVHGHQQQLQHPYRHQQQLQHPYRHQQQLQRCVFGCAVERGSVVLMEMLYESGAVGHHDLYRLQQALSRDLLTPQWAETHQRELRYLDQLLATPRSLQSSCRLVISHCLGLHPARADRGRQLRLSEELKSYVLLTDLTEVGGAASCEGGSLLYRGEKAMDICRKRCR